VVRVVVVVAVMMVVMVVHGHVLVDVVIIEANEGVSSVVEFCVAAGQDVSAGTDHVWGEGKLLAMEDEELSVDGELFFAFSAEILELTNSVLLFMDLVIVLADANPVVVVVNAVVVIGDAVVVGRDAVFEVIDVVVNID